MELISRYCLTRGIGGVTIKDRSFGYGDYLRIRHADLTGSYETTGTLAPSIDDQYIILIDDDDDDIHIWRGDINYVEDLCSLC